MKSAQVNLFKPSNTLPVKCSKLWCIQGVAFSWMWINVNKEPCPDIDSHVLVRVFHYLSESYTAHVVALCFWFVVLPCRWKSGCTTRQDPIQMRLLGPRIDSTVLATTLEVALSAVLAPRNKMESPYTESMSNSARKKKHEDCATRNVWLCVSNKNTKWYSLRPHTKWQNMDGCNINKSSRQTRNSACVALHPRANLYSRNEASAEVERNSVERVHAWGRRKYPPAQHI